MESCSLYSALWDRFFFHIIPLRFIQVIERINSLFLFYCWVIFRDRDIAQFNCSSTKGHLDSFLFFYYCEYSCCGYSHTTFCMGISLYFSGTNAKSAIVRLYAKSIFSFVRNRQAFSEWLHHFALPPATYELFSFSASCQHLVSSQFFILVISNKYRIVVWIGISLMANDIEYLFMRLFSIYIFPLLEIPMCVFCPF